MTFNELKILIPLIIQGVYDFIGWYIILKEVSGNKYEILFRIIKAVLDFAVTIPVLLLLHWSWDSIIAFYLLKWFGFCDAWYIILWKLFNPAKNYTTEGIWWMWWTPIGLIRSQLLYNSKDFLSHLPAYEYLKISKNWTFLKGVISLKEFNIQLGIGLITAFLINHFSLITKFIGLF